MNAKKAKALRKDARKYSHDAPTSGHVPLRNGQLIVSPYSERGLYRRLKRETRGEEPHAKDI